MGRVNFGAQEISKDQWQPFIEIKLADGDTVPFVTMRMFKTEAQAKEVAIASYMILSGDQKNVRFSEDGNA